MRLCNVIEKSSEIICVLLGYNVKESFKTRTLFYCRIVPLYNIFVPLSAILCRRILIKKIKINK